MSSWIVKYEDEAINDLQKLDGSIVNQVTRAIHKVSQNPLPQREGGYGAPLGNKNGIDLTGCLKIKLKKAGIRVVYTLERTETSMNIIIIGMRADLSVYKEAARRLGR